MSEPDRREEVLRAAENLQGSMDALRGDVRHLNEYGQRSRHMIWGLWGSLALDVVLSVVLAVVAVQAHNASSKATHATSQSNINRQTQVTTCKSTNQARATAEQLWIYVIDQSEKVNPQLDAEGQRQLELLRARVKMAYAQRDCSPGALAHSSPPPSK